MPTKLFEQHANGVKARIRLISAGIGSSGFYPAEVLERDGATAFPAGTHLFYNHITENEQWDRKGSRNVEDLVGKTLTDAEYIAEEEALYAEALFYNSSIDRVKDFYEDIALSIEGNGKRNEESGEIEALLPHPHNAIALVPRGGRDGKITEFLESMTRQDLPLSESGKIEGIETPPEKDTIEVTPEEIEKIAESLAKALATEFASIREALTPVAPETEDPAPEGESVAEVVEALIDADLPKELRTRVYESENPLQELETIKAIRESFKGDEGSAATPGKIQESAAASQVNFLSTTWSAK